MTAPLELPSRAEAGRRTADIPNGADARRAAWQEARLNLAAHPLLWPAVRLVARGGAARRVPGLGVVVNDALLAHEVLCHDDLFRKQGRGGIAEVMTQAFGPSALANMDGDPHRALRRRLGPLASSEQADAWLDASRGPLDRAFAALAQGRTVDLARTARALSGRLTLTLMGVEPASPAQVADDATVDADALEVHALGERIASALQLSRLPERRLGTVQADLDRLLGYAERAFASDTLPPGSLVGRLRTMGCTAEETRGILSIFFVAGVLTLGVALPRVIALLVDSRQLVLAHREPSLVGAAVDEGLRYTCPVPLTLRIATADTTLGGTLVRAGERVFVLTANLARDPQLFPEPHRYDITRAHDARARYLWYGAGPHFCLGFTLAQRALHAAVAQVAADHPSLRITRRRASRGVLLPAWRELHVVATNAA
jgi:cytochrome P450